MQSVTGTGWYDKGTVATASGTAKATYTDTGTTYTIDPSNSGHRYYAKHTYTVVPVNKTMDSAQTATINATESKSNGGGDQYYLTVQKGDNMQSVTGAGWYKAGNTATASGIPKAEYTDQGTNDSDYTVDPSNSGHRYHAKHTFTVVPVTKTMNSKQTVTVKANETISNGGGDQYKLTVTKDANVATVTPAVGSHWYNKGTKVNVGATYNTGYEASSGTGEYTMNSAQTANVTAKQQITPVTLALTGDSSGITSIETSEGTYTRNQTIYCKPGTTVRLYHASSRDWCYGDTSGGDHHIGVADSCHFTVPAGATGSASLYIYDRGDGDRLRYFSSSGWVASSACYPTLN